MVVPTMTPNLFTWFLHLESTKLLRSLSFSSLSFWALTCYSMESLKVSYWDPTLHLPGFLNSIFSYHFPLLRDNGHTLENGESNGGRRKEGLWRCWYWPTNNYRALTTWGEKESILTLGSLWQASNGWNRHENLRGSYEKGETTSVMGQLGFDLMKKMFSESSWLSFLLTLLQCLTQSYGWWLPDLYLQPRAFFSVLHYYL